MTPRDVLRRVRKLGLPAYGDDEVIFVASAMDRLRPTHVFEWGTNVGASARLFRESADVLGFACEVHTTELPLELAHLDRDHPGHRYGQWIDGVEGIVAHRGDGLAESTRAFEQIVPLRALWFLDGCHDHHVVLGELDVVALTDPLGVILVHDTLRLTGDAVRAFLAKRSADYSLETCDSDSGMMALWPSP